MNDKEKLFYHVEGWAAEHNRGRCSGKESFSFALKNNFSFKIKQKMNNKEKYLHKILDAVVESCSYIDSGKLFISKEDI